MTQIYNPDLSELIGAPISGGTDGSVLFVGTGGVLAQDNANLFWDDTNNRLGIGTNSPGNYSLNIVRAAETGVGEKIASFSIADNATAKFEIDNASSTDAAAVLRFNATGSGTSAAFTFQGNIETDSGTGPALIFNARLSSSGAIATRPIYDFRNNNTSQAIITAGGDFGIGTGTTVSARMHVISTTEQLRIGNDPSNYFSTTVDSVGGVMFAGVGGTPTFTFNRDTTVRRILTTTSTTSAPGMVITGQRANALYATIGATGGVAFSLVKATVENTDPIEATWLYMGVFGAANEGGGTPTSTYFFIDPSATASHSGAAFKITPGGMHGMGVASTTAPSARLHLSGSLSAASWTTNGMRLRLASGTYTDTSSSGTVSSITIDSNSNATLAASSAVTYTTASTYLITGAPTAGTNVTITNPLALHVSAGNVRIAANLQIGNNTSGAVARANFTISGDFTSANDFSVAGVRALFGNRTYTDGTGTGTVASFALDGHGGATVTATNSVTYTDAAAVYIANAPTASTNVTMTNRWSLWADQGDARFDANVYVGNGTLATRPTTILGVFDTLSPVVTIGRNDTGVTSGESIGKLQFWNNDTSLTTQNIYADIEVVAAQTISTDAAAATVIYRATGTAAASSPVEYMRGDANEVKFSLGQKVNRTTTAVTYTALVTDYIIGVTSTAAARTINLPAAATAGAGKIFIIKDESGACATNNITIDANSTELIDGATTYVMNVNYQSVTLYCSGTAWFII